jgi:hypothetical protein
MPASARSATRWSARRHRRRASSGECSRAGSHLVADPFAGEPAAYLGFGRQRRRLARQHLIPPSRPLAKPNPEPRLGRVIETCECEMVEHIGTDADLGGQMPDDRRCKISLLIGKVLILSASMRAVPQARAWQHQPDPTATPNPQLRVSSARQAHPPTTAAASSRPILEQAQYEPHSGPVILLGKNA